MYTIKRIHQHDIPEILELSAKVFKNQSFDTPTYLMTAADWSISVKLVDIVNDSIVGFYIFNEDQVDEIEGKGVQGVALGVDPEYKGLGLGKMLIDYSLTLDYDYIWGQHLQTLGNKNDWEKRRVIIDENAYLFVTAAMLKGDPKDIKFKNPHIKSN